MSALRKPVMSPTAPAPSRRVVALPRRAPRRRAHGLLAVEILLKLAVNGVLSAAAVVALTNLLPYHWTQQERLHEVRTEVRQTEKRVAQLRDSFSRSFDPSQASSVIHEQSGMTAPSQRRVVLLNPQPAEE